MDELAVSAIASASRVFREIFFMIGKPLIGFSLWATKDVARDVFKQLLAKPLTSDAVRSG